MPPGATIVWLSDSQRALAAFVLADTLRPQAIEMIALLRKRGLRVSILSGDAADAVAHHAAVLGVDDWQSDLGPEQKLAALEHMQDGGRSRGDGGRWHQ